MVNQHPLTLVTPVLASMKENLYDHLYQLKIDLEKRIHESFESIGTIHFCRWLIIDYDIEKGQSPMGDMPKLIFCSNFDGTAAQHIKDLCTTAGDIIDSVYACCENYPAPEERTPASREAYLNKWIVPASAFYRGSPDRSLKQIRSEKRLRNFIREYLDSKNWDNHSAREVHQKIKAAVFENPEFAWAKEPISLPKVNWFAMVIVGLILLILLPVLIIWILIVQYGYESRDKYFTMKRSQLDERIVKRLETYEDIEMQNQFSQLVWMKTGFVRLVTFKFMMLFGRTLIRYQFVKGKLLGMPTIHFARWVLFDSNKRVLFFSNFDGSWQQYLCDFIDRSGWGLTGIFSNTKNFPKTKFLITGGAYDEEHFLAWSRHSEIQTQIWYCAYPDLSIKNVNNNSKIRYGLIQDLSDSEAKDYLKLI